MKVVGLISGGKDSIYNLLKCQAHGHEIVALANLYPVEDEVSELDSFMYQTVGHQLIEAYAECSGLPVFRMRTHGKSHSQDLNYRKTMGDEVEDLLNLLAYVKLKLPEVDAVSSGAIASDYQRLRVENVCSRLDLVSLSFLWQKPQEPLLQEIIDAGIHAVLVKVAVMGLTPSKHLGKSLEYMQPILLSLNERFGCNVCGEGGEYETFTLDCHLFKHCMLVLDDWSIASFSNDSMAPVGALIPTRFHTQSKHGGPVPKPQVIEVPTDFHAPDAMVSRPQSSGVETVEDNVYFSANARFVTATARSLNRDCTSFPVHSFAATLACIQAGLGQRSASLDSAALVSVYLNSMAHFGDMNNVYKGFFPATEPAARVCVQLDLSCAYMLEIIVPITERRKVLHVQSISEWAPSCIGPYSQAVQLKDMTLFAGQIGLQPPTMTLHTNLEAQIHQTLSSCQVVAKALQFQIAEQLLAVNIFVSEEGGREAAQSTYDAVTADWIAPIDSPGLTRDWKARCVCLCVPALPRGASVEIQPLAYHIPDQLVSSSSSDDQEELKGQSVVPSVRSTSQTDQDGLGLELEMLTTKNGLALVTVWCRRLNAIQGGHNLDRLKQALVKAQEMAEKQLAAALAYPISCTLYYCKDFSEVDTLKSLDRTPSFVPGKALFALPVSDIWLDGNIEAIFLLRVLASV